MLDDRPVVNLNLSKGFKIQSIINVHRKGDKLRDQEIVEQFHS